MKTNVSILTKSFFHLSLKLLNWVQVKAQLSMQFTALPNRWHYCFPSILRIRIRVQRLAYIQLNVVPTLWLLAKYILNIAGFNDSIMALRNGILSCSIITQSDSTTILYPSTCVCVCVCSDACVVVCSCNNAGRRYLLTVFCFTSATVPSRVKRITVCSLLFFPKMYLQGNESFTKENVKS